MDLPIDEHGNLECTICSEAIGIPSDDTGKTESPIELPCGHTFGDKCLHKWRMTNNICPNCRAPCPGEEQYVRTPAPQRPRLGLRRQGHHNSMLEVRDFAEAERGSGAPRFVDIVRGLSRETVSPRARVQHDTIAGHDINRRQRMNSGAGNARDFESEALSARREAMLEDESPHHEFQAPTAASRSRHLATTTMLPGYASLLNLRRAQDTAFVMAVSNPNLRRGHSNRIAGDDIAEANERRPLDVTTGIVNGVPSFIARRRLNDDRRITYGASLREHGDSMNFRATSMNDLREEGRHRATHGFSNLNPARGVRQDERNLLRTTLEDEHSMGSMRGIERMRSSSDEVGRSEALDSHDPELVARWMHQQSLAELHELMMHLVELGGSDLRAHQARCMMAEIIQRRRQQRQSFMNELDRNDMDFAAEVGPILRVLDAQDSVQIMHLIKLRRETREAIAEVERPGRSDAPSPSAIQDSWEEMMVSGGWERMGRRRRS